MAHRKARHVTCFSQVTPQPVPWLWPGFLAAGKCTLIDGDPDQGKSLLTLDLAARLTTGRQWPDGQAIERPRSVILVGREDNIQDTVLPRLLAAGADPSKVHNFRVQNLDTGRICSPVFPDDCDLLRETIDDLDAGLAIIDPLFAFLSHRACYTSEQLVRSGLEPLADLAEDTGAALTMVRHLNKGGRGLRALQRGLGGTAIVSSVRLAFLAGVDPADPTRRVLAPLKTNPGERPPSLAYRIVSGPENRPILDWLGPTDLTADDLIVPARSRGGALPEAIAFLEEMLASGPCARDEIVSHAQARGLSFRTLERACQKLAIVSHGCQRHGRHVRYWCLPADQDRFTPDNWDDPAHRILLQDAANQRVLQELFGEPPAAPIP